MSVTRLRAKLHSEATNSPPMMRLPTAPPEMTVPKAVRLMVKHDVGRLPVMENGKVIGIFTRSDAMLYYYDQLPE